MLLRLIFMILVHGLTMFSVIVRPRTKLRVELPQQLAEALTQPPYHTPAAR